MNKKKTAIFVLSYCLDLDCRLTVWSHDSVVLAGNLFSSGLASDIILSVSHSTSDTEAHYKYQLLRSVDRSHIHLLTGSTDTFDEIRRVGPMLKSLRVEKLIVIAERWHALRIPGLMRRFLPGMEFQVVKFKTKVVEKTAQPSRIKSYLLGVPFLWIPWQLFFWVMNPIMARNKKP